MVSQKFVQRTNALLNRIEFFLHIFLGKWAMFWLFSIFTERSPLDQKLCPDFLPSQEKEHLLLTNNPSKSIKKAPRKLSNLRAVASSSLNSSTTPPASMTALDSAVKSRSLNQRFVRP